jgi:glycosyltransferase involved in cell wall biosynthesis
MQNHQVRRFAKKGLNVLVVGCTHERYEQQLCLTGHNFVCLQHAKKWNSSYGKRPENYILYNNLPTYICPDLILIHASDDRLGIAWELSNYFRIPIIRHTHTLPTSNEEVLAFHKFGPHVETFISEYSKNKWAPKNTSFVIDHGLDTSYWAPKKETKSKHVLSVVNLWAQRDWACGWNLYQEIKKLLPDVEFKVLGTNPGLSSPARSLEHLQEELSMCGVFLNTSLNSPIPMSLMEAMSCGAPVVSTDTCMIPEVVGESGLLGKTATELAKHITSVLTNPQHGVELSKRARAQIVDNYNIQKFIQKWNMVFDYAINNFR